MPQGSTPKLRHHRLAGSAVVSGLFVSSSLLTRIALLLHTPDAWSAGAAPLTQAFVWGALYDLAAASTLLFLAVPYLTLLPQRVFSSRWHRRFMAGFFLTLIYGLLFTAVAEWTFWDEFGTRFNFIAVDYLVYTREVIGNILESYPVLPILAGLLVLAVGILALLARTGWFEVWSRQRTPLGSRLRAAALWLVLPIAFLAALDGRTLPELGDQYAQELARNGPYSLFGAFRDNELPYARFYPRIPEAEATERLRRWLREDEARFAARDASRLLRHIDHPGPELRLNVVQITVESLSAKYLGVFGNDQGLTPYLDELAHNSLLFTRFYATGNRTVRGMEALTLSLPPTPGRSVVKRPRNAGLFSLGALFRKRGYDTQFLYGGYGYFDNMNAFFSGNGYRVIDRGSVPKEEVTFSNAWGAADEDLFRWSLAEADRAHAEGKPFFQFVMTTSNHRPFTYPEGRIAIPSHQGRHGGVQYTDWAIGEYFQQARTRPWFDDTLFLVVADHCAGTRGRVEIPPRRYHIPLMIHAPRHVQPGIVQRLSSQIDLAPTLLGLLHWSYESRFFGRDVLAMDAGEERALIATYQSLGYLKDDRLTVLRPVREILGFRRKGKGEEVEPAPVDRELARDAIAIYQSAGRVLAQGLYRAAGDGAEGSSQVAVQRVPFQRPR